MSAAATALSGQQGSKSSNFDTEMMRRHLATCTAGLGRPLLLDLCHRSPSTWRMAARPTCAAGRCLAQRRGGYASLQHRSHSQGASCQASRKGAAKVEDDLDWDPVEPPAESGGGKEGQAAKEAESFANSFMDYVKVKENSDGEDRPGKEPKEEAAHSEDAPEAVKAPEAAGAESEQQWEGDLSQEERKRMDSEAEQFALELMENPGATFLGEEEKEQEATAREQPPVKKGRKRIDRRTGRPKDFSIPLHLLPKVAIVGRPNVGKSALFNRITGSNLAIVYDYPGVTRDRMYTRAMWGTSEFVVVDTGGLMSEAVKLPDDTRMKAVRGISDVDLPMAVERQAAAGVAEADSLLLVVDGQQGLTASDEEIVTWLRRRHPKKPVTLAVNKCENLRVADTQAAEFWATGLEPTPVSAISGSGSGDLLDRLVATLPEIKAGVQATAPRDPPLAMAIIGRPNVGKSSLLNALVGSERSIVSSVSGTTRDAVDTEVVAPGGQVFNLIDTAGIRKRAAVTDSPDGAEPLSVQRAIQAVRRSQVVVLVLDAVECTIDGRFVVTQQDFRLSELIAAEGRAAVVVVNKWDAVPSKDTHTLATYQKEILASLRPIDWATVVFTSALSGQRVGKILQAVAAAGEEHSRRVSTATLNMVVRETLNWRSPPVAKSGKKGKIYYATQAAVRPPTFVFFVNDPDLFGEDYRRYVARQLRTNIGFPGSPLRVYWRGKTSRPRPTGLGE